MAWRAVTAAFGAAVLFAHATVAPAWPVEKDAAPRYMHPIDLAIVKPYLSPQGFLDPAYTALIAAPSPYLADFYGIQAIADVSRKDILHDFVPRLATEVVHDDHSLTLRFRAGYVATFYPHSSMQVKDLSVPVSHVAISGDTWHDIRAHVADFVTDVQKAGLADTYLIRNRHYPQEQQVAKQKASGHPVHVVIDPALAAFDRSPNAVLLMPESVHGNPAQAEQLMALLRPHRFEWLAMEMIPHADQVELDAFNRAHEGTPAYAAARATLVAYFAAQWNGRASPKTRGDQNYYFKLVEAAHHNGTKVIGAEGTDLAFTLFRNGETPFGAAVRSLLWTRVMPRTGRGVLFAGSAHMTGDGAINAQDFIDLAAPGRPVMALRALKKPLAS